MRSFNLQIGSTVISARSRHFRQLLAIVFMLCTLAPDSASADQPTGLPSETKPVIVYQPYDGQTVNSSTIPLVFGYDNLGYQSWEIHKRCSLDGGTTNSCPGTLARLAQGQHTLRVFLATGNSLSPTPIPGAEVTIDFTVDDTAGPSVAPLYEMAAPTTDSSETVRVAADFDTQQIIATTPSGESSFCDSGYTAGDQYEDVWFPIGWRSLPVAKTFSCPLWGLDQGENQITFQAWDQIANGSNTVLPMLVSDTVPPILAISAPTNGQVLGYPGAGIQYTVQGALSGSVRCRIDGGTWQRCVDSGSSTYYPSLSYGQHTVELTALDGAGNHGYTSVTFSIEDPEPPLVTFSSPAEGFEASSPFSFNFDASDDRGLRSVSCRIVGHGWDNCNYETSFAVNQLAAGGYVFEIRAVDLAGNTTTASRSFSVIDTDAPDVAIDPTFGTKAFDSSVVSGPAFTITEPEARLRCRVDEKPCSATYGQIEFLNPFVNGAHELSLVATDWAGNVTSKNVVFHVNDTTTPSISLVSPTEGAELGNADNVAFEFTVTPEKPVTFACSADGPQSAPSKPTPTGCTFDHFPSGDYTLTAIARDTAGNTSAPLIASFSINDTTPPSVVLTGPNSVPGQTHTSPVAFSFQTIDAAVVRCRLDSNPRTDCGSSYTTPSSLKSGNHTFTVEVRDRSGNSSMASVEFNYVNSDVSQVWIQSPVSGSVINAAIAPDISVFHFRNDYPTFICSVDGVMFSISTNNCNSNSWVWRTLGSGSHELTVRMRTSAGDTATATSRFAIVEPPHEVVAIRYPRPGEVYTDSSAIFVNIDWGVDSANGHCRIDLGPWTPCNSPQLTAPNGNHTLTAQRVSSEGHVTTSSVNFEVADSTPPSISIGGISDGDRLTTTDGFDLNVSTVGGTGQPVCRLDNRRLASCSSASTSTPGQHALQAEIRDPAGNLATAKVVFSLELPETDALPLGLAVSSPTPGATVSQLPTVSYSAHWNRIDRIEGWVDDNAWDTSTLDENGEWPIQYPLAPGNHELKIRAYGLEGQTEQVAIPITVKELSAIGLRVDIPKDGSILTEAPAFAMLNTYELSSFGSIECMVDEVLTVCEEGVVPLINLSQGSHSVRFRVTDQLGGSTDAVSNFVINDTRAPEFTIESPEPDVTYAEPPLLVLDGLNFNAVPVRLECKINGVRIEFMYSNIGLDCIPNTLLNSVVDGENIFELTAIDGAGNASTQSMTFYAELNDEQVSSTPVLNIHHPRADTVFTESETAAASWTAFDADGTGAFVGWTTPTQCSDDGTVWNACGLHASPFDPRAGSFVGYEVPATNGRHTLFVRATNSLGSTTTSSVTYEVDDHSSPYLNVVSPRSGEVTEMSDFQLISSIVGRTKVECSLDGGPFVRCHNSEYDQIHSSDLWTSAQLSTGSHQLRFRATDPAGNQTVVVRNFAIGSESLAIYASDGPGEFTRLTDVELSFSATPTGARGACIIDGGDTNLVDSPLALNSLSEGSHEVRCRATLDDEFSPDEAVWSFTVDTTAPDTTLTANVPSLTKSPTPTLPLGSNEVGVTYRCSIDGNDPITHTPSLALPHLEDGEHTVECVATDRAGNTDDTPISTTFLVDTIAPVTSIVGPTLTRFVNTSFSITANEPLSTKRCRLDERTYNSVSSTFMSSPPLSEGDHTISCRSTDLAGNVETTDVQHTFTLDTIPPETTIHNAPPALSRDTRVSVQVSADEYGSTLECSLNRSSWETIEATATFSDIPDGNHIIYCRGIDPAGNIDPSAATASFSVDTTPPVINFIAPGEGTYLGSRNVEVKSLVTDAHDFELSCKLDGIALEECGPIAALSELDEGNHSFEINAVDEPGNNSSNTRTFVVDVTTPDVSVVAPPAVRQRARIIRVGVQSNEPGVTECRFDTSDWILSISEVVTSGSLADGTHSYECRARDLAGNNSEPTAPSEFDIDATPPTIDIDSPAAGTTVVTATPMFMFDAHDASGVSATCAIAGRPPVDCESPWTPAALAAGNATLRVDVVDGFGNSATSSRTITVDLTPPDTSFVHRPAALASNASPEIVPTSNVAGSTFECTLDSGIWTQVSSSWTLGPLSDGAHTIACRATDTHGRTDPTPAAWSFVVDTVVPELAITAPIQGSTVTTPRPALTYSVHDLNPGIIRCALDSGPFIGCGAVSGGTWLSDGEHTYRVRATDGAGNVAETSTTFVVDASDEVPPETTFLSAPSGNVAVAGPFYFASDDLDARFECQIDDEVTWLPCISGRTLHWLENGPHQLRVRAVDPYENADPTPAIADFTLVDPAEPNLPPVPNLSISRSSGAAPLGTTMSFAATDPEGSGLDYKLNFGDGSDVLTGALPTAPVSHTYTAAGTYYATLEVTDGQSSRALVRTITVEPNLPLNPEAGADKIVRAGTSVSFSGADSTPASQIDSYQWDFGDGQTGTGISPQHTFEEAGTYTVELTVTKGDDVLTDTLTVIVHPPDAPSLKLNVRSDGAPVSGVNALINAPNGARHEATTGADGKAELFGIDTSSASIYVWADGYVPQMVEAELELGEGTVDVELVAGAPGATTLSSRELTLEEIEDLGIDIENPANTHTYAVKLNLFFEPIYPPVPVQMVIWGGPNSGWVCTTGCIKPSNGGGPNGTPGPGQAVRVGQREFYPQITWYDGEPVIQWLVVPVKASWLKQFFEVSLVVQNLTSGLAFAPGTATLNTPEGLKLIRKGEMQPQTQDVPAIPSGESKEVTWVVRGDTEGEYDLSAEYVSVLNPIGQPLRLFAQSEKKLKVWGGSALAMNIATDPTAVRNAPFHIDVELTNKADVPVYNPGIALNRYAKEEEIENARYVLPPAIPGNDPNKQSVDSIAPGDSWKAEFVVFPELGNEWVLNLKNVLRKSFVAGIGGDVSVSPALSQRESEEGEILRVEVDFARGTNGNDEALLKLEPHPIWGGKRVNFSDETWAFDRKGYFAGGKGWTRLKAGQFIVSGANEIRVLEPSLVAGREITFGSQGIGDNTTRAWNHPVGPYGPRYVALGDSFSSGEGNQPYENDTAVQTRWWQFWRDSERDNVCHRSQKHSYSRILVADPRLKGDIEPAIFRACSGATLASIWKKNGEHFGEPEQSAHLTSATRLVTFSFGGNDIGFSAIAKRCLVEVLSCAESKLAEELLGQPYEPGKNYSAHKINVLMEECKSASPPASRCTTKAMKEAATDGEDADFVGVVNNLYDGTLANRLDKGMSEIHRRSPRSFTFVQLYPQMTEDRIDPISFGCDVPWEGGPDTFTLNALEQFTVRILVDKLNQAVIDAVRRARSRGQHIDWVDPNPLFAGHEICSGDEPNPDTYFHGVVDVLGGQGVAESLHPNPEGQKAYEEALIRKVNAGINSGSVRVPRRKADAAGRMKFQVGPIGGDLTYPGRGNAGTVEVNQDDTELWISAEWFDGEMRIVATSPSGEEFTADSNETSVENDDNSQHLTVNGPERGEWKVELEAEPFENEEGIAEVSAHAFHPAPEPLDVPITASPLEGNDLYSFSAEGSDNYEYKWTFSDGTRTNGKTLAHRFPPQGTRWAVVQVTASNGRNGMDQIVLPAADFTSPVLFRGPASYSVDATSPNGAKANFDLPLFTDDHDVVILEPKCTIEPGSELPIGITPIDCTATDQAGNSAGYSFQITVVDRSTISIGKQPPALTRLTTAEFHFSNPKGGPYECALDSTEYIDCESPIEYHGLPPGVHSFRVRSGGEEAGHFPPTVVNWSIETAGGTVPPDLQPPSISITKPACPKRIAKRRSKCKTWLTSHGAWRKLRGTATDASPIARIDLSLFAKVKRTWFALSGTKLKRVKSKSEAVSTISHAKVSGSAWSASLPKLPRGNWTFRVRAHDSVGNASGWTVLKTKIR